MLIYMYSYFPYLLSCLCKTQVFRMQKGMNKRRFQSLECWFPSSNGGLPISRVAPLDQLLPLSLGSSGWFSQYMPYEDSKDFLSNNCSIRTRYLYTLTQYFPNQQWCNKSTYDLVERLLFPLLFYRRYIKFTERYSDVSRFRMIFNLIYLSSI